MLSYNRLGSMPSDVLKYLADNEAHRKLYTPKTILSKQGIRAINHFIHELSVFAQREFGEAASPQSTYQVKQILKLCKELLNYNDVALWTEGSVNRDELLKTLHSLDQNKHTFTPDVFNTHSYKLAIRLIKFLRTTRDDLFEKENKAEIDRLFSVADPIGKLEHALQQKVNLYLAIVKSNQANELFTITEEIEHTFLHLQTQAKRLSKAEYAAFVKLYKEEQLRLITLTRRLPYFVINNADDFRDAHVSYPASQIEISDQSPRLQCINLLIRHERKLNDCLLHNTLKPITTIEDTFTQHYVKSKNQQLIVRFIKLSAELKNELDNYPLGNHLSFFSSLKGVDQDKLRLLTDIYNLMQNYLNTFATRADEPIFTDKILIPLHQIAVHAFKQNTAIAKEKKISDGELANIFQRLAYNLLMLLTDIDETNDSRLVRTLKRYRYANMETATVDHRIAHAEFTAKGDHTLIEHLDDDPFMLIDAPAPRRL